MFSIQSMVSLKTSIAFFFGMSYKNPMMRSLWALGLSAILFGLWSLCDTGLPQLLTGTTYASREIVYLILHLAGFPMIYFVNSKTKQQKKIYPYSWIYYSANRSSEIITA